MSAKLFLVGAMKAGTTSLYEYLSTHPNIYMSPIKEPNYFVNELPKSIDEGDRKKCIKEYLENGLGDFVHFARLQTVHDYKRLFSLAKGEQYLGEASTAYFHAKESPKLIKDSCPDSKIIILLRDPIDRAYSHYKMDKTKGRVRKDFWELVIKEIREWEENNGDRWGYLGMSLYYNNLKRYLGLFSRQQVFISNLNCLINDREVFFDRLSSFLGVKNCFTINSKVKNKSRAPKWELLNYLLHHSGLKNFIRNRFSGEIINKAKCFFYTNPNSLDLTDRQLSKLRSFFEEDQKKISNLLINKNIF